MVARGRDESINSERPPAGAASAPRDMACRGVAYRAGKQTGDTSGLGSTMHHAFLPLLLVLPPVREECRWAFSTLPVCSCAALLYALLQKHRDEDGLGGPPALARGGEKRDCLCARKPHRAARRTLLRRGNVIADPERAPASLSDSGAGAYRRRGGTCCCVPTPRLQPSPPQTFWAVSSAFHYLSVDSAASPRWLMGASAGSCYSLPVSPLPLLYHETCPGLEPQETFLV